MPDRADHHGSPPPWYAEGLRFACTQCGNCCTGPPGVVRFTSAEGRGMAEALGIDETAFHARYAHQVDGGWSLRERKTEHGFDCVFLDRRSSPGKVMCSLYAARPGQCRRWPFWPENLASRGAWTKIKRTTPCPGMDSGPLIPAEEIRVLRGDGES